MSAPRPRFIFDLYIDAAADAIIADYETDWPRWKRFILHLWADARRAVLGPLWNWPD